MENHLDTILKMEKMYREMLTEHISEELAEVYARQRVLSILDSKEMEASEDDIKEVIEGSKSTPIDIIAAIEESGMDGGEMDDYTHFCVQVGVLEFTDSESGVVSEDFRETGNYTKELTVDDKLSVFGAYVLGGIKDEYSNKIQLMWSNILQGVAEGIGEAYGNK